MRKTILKPIVLGVLASAIITGCSSGGGDSGQKEAKACVYNIQGGNDVSIKFGTLYSEPTVKATQDGNPVVVTQTGNVNSNKLGTYKVTYSSESCTNNQVRTVKVIASTCSYKLLGSSPINVALNGVYEELGVEAKDINNKTVEYKITGKVDTTKEGKYILSYKGVGCENSQEREVNITAETNACNYELTGGDNLIIALNSEYIDPGVIVKNIKDNTQIRNVETSGDIIDPKIAKEYTVIYQGEGCSNDIKRTVTVKAPTECTYKLVDGDKPYTLVEGEDYKEPGCTVEDSIDKTTTACTSTNTIKKDKIGEYKVTYQNAGCNNTITRTVNVVAAECTYTFNPDNTNPLVIYKGDTYDASIIKPVVKGTDNNEISADKVKVKSDTVDTTKKGEYETIYEAEGCPNTGKRTVMVELANCEYQFPEDKSTLNILVGQDYELPKVTIKNMPDIEVNFIEDTVKKDTAGTYTVTYEAKDDCVNTDNFIVNVKQMTDEDLKEIKDKIGETILPKI